MKKIIAATLAVFYLVWMQLGACFADSILITPPPLSGSSQNDTKTSSSKLSGKEPTDKSEVLVKPITKAKAADKTTNKPTAPATTLRANACLLASLASIDKMRTTSPKSLGLTADKKLQAGVGRVINRTEKRVPQWVKIALEGKQPWIKKISASYSKKILCKEENILEPEGKIRTNPADAKLIPLMDTPPLKLNMQRALELGLANNPDLNIALAKIKYARGQYDETKSAQNFKLRLRGTYTRLDPVSEISFGLIPNKPPAKIKLGSENNLSGQVILEKLITTFGNVENTVAGVALNVLAAEENYLETRQDVILKVKENYYEVLRAQGVVKIAKENIDIVREQLRVSNDLYDAGVVPRFEVLRNELFLSQARQVLITAEKNRALTLSAFLDSINLDINTPVVLDQDIQIKSPQIDLSTAEKIALENRHEIKSLRISIQAARKFLEAARNGMNPVLSFQNILENKTVSGFSNEPTTNTAMLVLSIPVFDGGATYGQIKKAEASLKELEETLDKVTRGIKLEVKQAYLAIKEVEAKIDAANQDVRTAEESYAIAKARFENGISTGLELDDARRNLNNSRAIYINTLFEYHIAIARFEKAIAADWKGETGK